MSVHVCGGFAEQQRQELVDVMGGGTSLREVVVSTLLLKGEFRSECDV
jgi:hypothetical protein